MVQNNPLRGNKFIEVHVVRNGERFNTSRPDGLKHGNREIYFLGVDSFSGTISNESEYNMEQLNLLYTGKPCIFTDKVADSVDGILYS